MPAADEWSIRIHGYTTLTAPDIANHLNTGRAADLLKQPGSFVIAATRATSETFLITSAYGTANYFYTLHDGTLYHAPTVADVLRESAIPFRWNLPAIIDYFTFEHVTGTHTLHPDVHRTPPASVLHFHAGKLQTTTLSWSDLHPETGPADPDRAADVFAEEVARFAGPDPVLSASAGFDSRLLLAALLHAGLRPRLVVAGSPNSTDRVVTEQIAKHYNLPVIPIEVAPNQFPPAAATIATATNGTKPALHWHTYLYPHLAQLSPTDRLFVGANGEFARSYFLDKGLASRAADLLPARPLSHQYWSRKSLLSRAVRTEDVKHLSSALADAVRRADVAGRMWSLHPDRSLLRHFDQVYLHERVRHFIANGLALYALSATPITPFLSTPLVSEIDRLPRSWKLGSRWHRHAIARLQPALLNFLEQGTTGPMTPTPKPFYYKRNMTPSVPLFDRDAVFRDAEFRALLPAHADAIADLVDPAYLRSTPLPTRLFADLLPLAIWRTNLSNF